MHTRLSTGVSDFWALTEITYVRRLPSLGNLVGGSAECWDLLNDAGAIVATLREQMTVIERVGRFLSSRFAYQQRHDLTVHDSSGARLFEIVKGIPRLGRDAADILTADRTKAGTIQLKSPTGTDRLGLGLIDSDGCAVGEVRQVAGSYATERRLFDIVGADGGGLGQLTTECECTTLSLNDPLTQTTRTLILAIPIVHVFIR